jgi:hypothetical protein
MTDLFSSPILRIEQRSSQLDYQISDGHDQVIGRATQVAGPKPRKGFLGMFGSGLKDARMVVQVSGCDGAPLFYVDYQDGASAAVVAPDGTVVGRFSDDRLAVAQEMAVGGAAGMARRALGAAAPVMKHCLVDADDRTVCELHWRFKPVGDVEDRRWVPVACDYTDVNGQRIAQVHVRQATFKDCYVLQLMYQLPEPLRMLVIASPLAYDLSRS